MRLAAISQGLALLVLGLSAQSLWADTAVKIALPDPLSQQALQALGNGEGNVLLSPQSLVDVVALSRAGLGETPPTALMPSTVVSANAAWFDTTAVPTAEASKTLTTDWDAPPVSLDMAKDGKTKINEWVREATEGRIQDLITDPLVGVSVVLTNALVFKDAWRVPFDPDETIPRDFHLTGDETVEVPFMLSPVAALCQDSEQGVLVALSFAEAGHLVLRPQAEEAAMTCTGELEASDEGADDNRLVQVAMPRIDLTADLDLSGLVKTLGLSAAMAEGFAYLTVAPSVPGPVLQSVLFRADEEGAEAAAATAAIGVRSVRVPESPLLVFDRPFEFFVMMPGHDTAMIAGILRDPR
ncbi:MAG: serpin family protein [Pseudomonadota bacterium]